MKISLFPKPNHFPWPCSILIGFLVSYAFAEGANAESKRVQFDTVDEVTLEGTYYPSEGGSKSPCAILLHEIGGSRQHPGWAALAKKLQEGGFAVVQFDFRGHGDSTGVDPTFWKVSVNSRLKNAAAKKSQISYKDFPPGYWPMLANDIAAAKRFLDLKNDLGECNSGNLVLIGAQEGATLGALWLAAEGQRKPAKKNQAVMVPVALVQDIAAAVWLSISPNFGGGKPSPVLPDNWLRPFRDKIPMAFLYGDEDKNAAALAQTLCYQVLKADVPPRLKHTAAKSFKTKAGGIDLVSKVPGAEEKILNYLQKVLEARTEPAWWDRETKKRAVDFVNLKTAGIP